MIPETPARENLDFGAITLPHCQDAWSISPCLHGRCRGSDGSGWSWVRELCLSAIPLSSRCRSIREVFLLLDSTESSVLLWNPQSSCQVTFMQFLIETQSRVVAGSDGREETSFTMAGHRPIRSTDRRIHTCKTEEGDNAFHAV